MGGHVLLLGNGINDVTNSYKWENLLNDVKGYLNLMHINDNEKPFPLLYEEIFLTNLREKKIPEDKLKSYIAERLRDLRPNIIHEKIKSLNLFDIITTNYDYTIEYSIANVGKYLEDKGIVNQRRYSIFRHTEINGCKVWHIHGEINKLNTILLGYEHYSGQLQQMRDYVVSGTGGAYKTPFTPLIKLIKNGKVKNNSWLDLFFTKDIHIVGLSLDFVELDLWWLLTYRARIILEKLLLINNKITYYYPKSLGNKIQHKLEMFKANEIITKAFGDKPDLDYYNNVFDYLNKLIK